MPIHGVAAGPSVPRLGRKRANTLEDAMPSVSPLSHQSIPLVPFFLLGIPGHSLDCVALLKHEISVVRATSRILYTGGMKRIPALGENMASLSDL